MENNINTTTQSNTTDTVKTGDTQAAEELKTVKQEVEKFLTYTEAKEEINKEVDIKLSTVMQRLETLEKNLSSEDYSKQIIQKVQRAFVKDDRLSPSKQEPAKEKLTDPSKGDEEGIKTIQEQVNKSLKQFRR